MTSIVSRSVAVALSAMILLVAASQIFAGPKGTLTTKTFKVTVTVNCEEGEVTCDDVSYVGENKKTGETIELKGKTAHHMGADGTPGRFLGYVFKNKGVQYFLSEDGMLRITKGDEVLLEENGKWTWDEGTDDEAADSKKSHDGQKKE